MQHTTNDFSYLSTTAFKNAGSLASGCCGQLQWNDGHRGEFFIGQNQARFKIKWSGGQRKETVEVIDLVRRPLPYSGERVYFLCPHCRRKRSILYLVKTCLTCRTCAKLVHETQTMGKADRLVWKIKTIFERLGDANEDVFRGLPSRPKHMPQARYEKLCKQVREAQQSLAAAVIARFS